MFLTRKRRLLLYHIEFLMCKILISKYNAQNPTGNVSLLTSWFFSLYPQLQKETYRILWYFLSQYFPISKINHFLTAVQKLKLSLVKTRIYSSHETKDESCLKLCGFFFFERLYIFPTDQKLISVSSLEILSYQMMGFWCPLLSNDQNCWVGISTKAF